MKKRDLLFAGLLLMGASAFAQLQRTPQDAKLIFTQNFEDDFGAWSSEIVDSITVLQYYNNAQTGTKNNFKIWESANKADFDFVNNVIERTDSVLYLKNGVVLTDDATEIKNHNYDKDKYTILEDNSPQRQAAFEQFGEADKGGDYMFQFISDTCHYAPSWNPSAVQTYTPEYRRNLFVRGLDIEDTTSYRLSFYVKARKVKDGADPRMYVDLMRGYFHAEKRFTMGLENDADHYKYNAAYYLEKHGWQEVTDDTPNPFTGEWEKVTLMSYYTNDSIANSYVFIDGYWWDGDWTWTKDSKEPVPTDHKLIYTVQPDKFFVRLSFSSDDTEFLVDNISLTKSTIAGVEYAGGKMRVDFGYKTNLGELAQAAYAQNKIDAVEVKNGASYDKYFTVYGHFPGDGSWMKLPIESGEYHGDGYMYMFAPMVGDQQLSFDQFDSLYVTFHNPVDQPSLALKYTGKGTSNTEVFPRAWDTAWVKAGKYVPDFYNELAKRNPYAVQGVFSMKELPPVLQNQEYEEGSFGIPATTQTFWFDFSREVIAADPVKDLIATLGSEVLSASWETTGADGKSGRLTLTRTGSTQLDGDMELTLSQIKGEGTPEAEPLTFHYHFGSYTRQNAWSKKSDWRGEINITDEDGMWRRPIPASLYYWYASEGFFKGTGDNQYFTQADETLKRTSLGLYKMNDNIKFGDCWFYLSGGAQDTKGDLYTIESLEAGSYILSFPAYGWGSTSRPVTTVKVYPKPEHIDTHDSFDTLTTKVEIGKITKTNYQRAYSGDEPKSIDPANGYDDSNLNWGDNTNIFEFAFEIPKDGEYVIEWEVISASSTSYYGIALGNYTIEQKVSDQLWFMPTNNLNKSVDVATAIIEQANAALNLYGGADLQALTAKRNADAIGGTFTSIYPSEWKAEKEALDKAVSDFQGRMSKVDGLKKALDDIAEIKATYGEKQESGMQDYDAAIKGAAVYSEIDYNAMTQDSIDGCTKALNTLITNFNNYLAKFADFAKDKAAAAALLAKYAADYSGLAEYQAIDAAYATAAEFDSIGSTYDELSAADKALASANSAIEGKITSAQILNKQVDALAQLISDLDIDGIEVPEEYEEMNVLLDDKIGYYMLIAKKALYTAYLENYLDEDTLIDVSSAFLTNGQLWTIVTKEQLGSHQIMNSAVISGTTVTNDAYPLDLDFFPGWTWTWKKGNPYIGNGTSWQDGTAATAGNILNSFVNLDWNTGFTLEQTIEYLPVGRYELGVGYKIKASANDGHMIVYDMNDEVLADSLLDKYTSGSATGGADPNQFLEFANDGGVKLFINPSCGNEGWGSFDNVTLKFQGFAEDFDYEAALDAIDDEIELKTVVIPVKAIKGVKYFDINGVEQNAPKAGLNIQVVDGVATKMFIK